MDVVQSIWVSSVTGAGLFLSVGLLVSRAFPPKAGPNPEQPGEREARQLAEAQIASYQKQSEEAARQLAEERSQAAALRARIQSDAQAGEQLQNERRLRDEARQEAQRLAASLSRLEAEATQLRAAAGAAGRAGDSRQLTEENGRFRAQLGQLSGEVEAYRAQLQQRDAELNAIRAQLATSESRGSMAQKQVQAAEGQIQRGREQLQELQGARARAEAEVAQLRESIKNAGQTAAGGASAAAARVQQLEAKVAELQRKASEADARQREVQQLTAQLAAAQAKSNEAPQLAQQLAAAQARLAQVDAKEAQQLAVAQAHANQAQQLAQQLTTAQGQIRDARAALVSAENRSQDAVRLREENNTLRAQLAELQKNGQDAPHSVTDTQRRDVEMSLKARALAQRQEEFDIHIAEIESLRTKVESLTDAANETVGLRERVRELEAQGYAAKIARGDGWTKRPAKSNAGPDRLENMLQNKLEAVVTETKGCSTAVLADLRGLLIAASGDISFQDELAAAASLTTYTTARLQELFPMGTPVAMEMTDINRVTLRVDWLHMDDDSFLLTTVGLAPDPSPVREAHSRAIMDELAGD